MKKNGYTLVEVLITMVTIGIIVAITLPILRTNTQEQESLATFKKVIHTINEVVQTNVAENEFSFANIDTTTAPSARAIVNAYGAMEHSVWAMFLDNAQVNVTASYAGGITGGCQRLNQIFFRDGTALCYAATQTNSENDTITAVIDINGKKAPNKLSTCEDEDCVAGKSIHDQ